MEHHSSLLLGFVTLATVGCIRSNDEHCLFDGGDFANGEVSRICVVVEPGSEETLQLDAQGWLDGKDRKSFDSLPAAELPTGYHWVPFGLPESFEERSPPDLRSVEGVFDAAVQERMKTGCALADSRSNEWLALERYRSETLDRKTLVRLDAAELPFAALDAFSSALLQDLEGCDDTLSGTETDSSTGGQTDSSTGSDQTDSTTMGDEPCRDDAQCMARDPAKPFCDSEGMCVDCSEIPAADEPCATLDPLAPLCVDGACVACGETTFCEEQLLVCDVDAGACVPCTAHDQCESGACDLLAAMPTCFEPENVFEVGMGQAYPTIGFALTAVNQMVLDRAVLRLHDGQAFDEARTVSSGAIAFVAASGDDPEWINSFLGAPTLTVSGANTRVYFDQVRVELNEAVGNHRGIICNGAAVHVQRSRVTENNGGGITATNGCDLHVHNSFVGGGGSNPGRAGLIVDDSSATLSYSTFINYAAPTYTAIAIECTGTSAVTSRNSIIVTRNGDPGTELACPMLDASHTVAETLLPGPSNFNAGPFPDASPEDWFVAIFSGDFHLQNNALTLFENVAEWQTGDPTTDLDGDPRPSTNNTPDYPGADVP